MNNIKQNWICNMRLEWKDDVLRDMSFGVPDGKYREYEKEILEKNGKTDSLILVDLRNKPTHLKELAELM